MTTLLSGGCLCGHITFIAANPGASHSCSCDLCQKHTGAQSAVWRSSEDSSRAFCPRCGSSLGAIDDGPIIALLSGVFDQNQDARFAPASHSFEDMKPQWWRALFADA